MSFCWLIGSYVCCMKGVFLVGFMVLNPIVSPLLFDFGSKAEGDKWYVVNDGVMGGLSASGVDVTDNGILFKGVVSLENNGGFASLRSPYGQLDLSTYRKVTIRYKASGQVPALSFDKDRRFYIPYYKMPLNNVSDEWTTETHELLEINEYYLGQPTGKKLSRQQLSSIIRMGFLVSNKKAGAFELQVDYIKFE